MEEIKAGININQQERIYAYLDGKHAAIDDIRINRIDSYHIVLSYSHDAEAEILFLEGYKKVIYEEEQRNRKVELGDRSRRDFNITEVSDRQEA